MNRREALRRTALLMGGALSAPAILGVLKGCTAKPVINWKPEFLSNDQGILISDLTEIILPKTDTLGAKDIGIPGFIDKMLKDVFTKKEQDEFLEGLIAFDNRAEVEFGDLFNELSPEDKTSFVKKIHQEEIENYLTSRPKGISTFVLLTKELTMLGYFTSEEGATKVLQYEPVPGAYNGCLPIQEAGNGRTWAT